MTHREIGFIVCLSIIIISVVIIIYKYKKRNK